jgi:hypothetical protein
MLRIPGSYNSKCIKEGTDAEVRVIQTCDLSFPGISYLIGDFHAYLVDKERERRCTTTSNPIHSIGDSSISWIEKLLAIGIPDHRKYAISLIVVPYLMNIKGYSEDRITATVNTWLEKCANLRSLDFGPKYIIKQAIRNASKGYRPMKRETLKEKNPELYSVLDL